MRSLFGDWPSHRLRQVYLPAGRGCAPGDTLGEECLEVPAIGSPRRHRLLGRDQGRDPLGAERDSRLLSWVKRAPLAAGAARAFQEAWYATRIHSASLVSEIERFKPDVVYSLVGNLPLARLVTIAAQRTRAPLYVHITDDWPDSLYRGVVGSGLLRSASRMWLRRAADMSAARSGVSPAMAEEYGRLYGRPWDWFTTSVEPSAYDPTARISDGVVRFVYAGNLGLGRADSLARLAAAVDRIGGEARVRTCLDVYASPDQVRKFGRSLVSNAAVNVRGWIDGSQLPEVFHNADVLIHAESFDPDVAKLTRLSFSTKLNQYLMAGRCVVAMGPRELASVKLVEQAGAGPVLTASSGPSMESRLRSIIGDQELRRSFGAAGRRWAESWGEVQSTRERFLNAIRTASGLATPDKATKAA